MRRLLWVAVLLSFACEAPLRWSERLDQRMRTADLGEQATWLPQAQHARSLAITHRESGNEDLAVAWATVADKYLSAAIVADKTARQEGNNRLLAAGNDELREKVESLESELRASTTKRRWQARNDQVSGAATQAYEEAKEYEARRFRRRNEDIVKLKRARKALINRVRLFLYSAKAMDSTLDIKTPLTAAEQCASIRRVLEGLDCANLSSWNAAQLFIDARAAHTTLRTANTTHLRNRLQKRLVPTAWENHALSAVIEDGTPLKRLATLVAKHTTGPVQLQGQEKDVRRVRRLLLDGGVPKNRFARSALDGSEFVSVRLLAYLPFGPPTVRTVQVK